MTRRPPARRFSAAAAVVLGVVALTGCSVPSNTPGGYDEGSVREFFLDGCQGGGTTDDTTVIEVDGTTTTLAPRDVCECAFDVFRDRVPYDDEAKEQDERFADYDGPTFLDLDGDAGSDPAGVRDQLPVAIREQIEACSQPG